MFPWQISLKNRVLLGALSFREPTPQVSDISVYQLCHCLRVLSKIVKMLLLEVTFIFARVDVVQQFANAPARPKQIAYVVPVAAAAVSLGYVVCDRQGSASHLRIQSISLVARQHPRKFEYALPKLSGFLVYLEIFKALGDSCRSCLCLPDRPVSEPVNRLTRQPVNRLTGQPIVCSSISSSMSSATPSSVGSN